MGETATYRLSTRKYCPTCGGKAQDARIDPTTSLLVKEIAEDGTVILEDGYTEIEPCDEPYHDPTDPDYVED